MKSKFNALDKLMNAEMKLVALAHLIESYQPSVPAEDSELYGLGLILNELANELKRTRHEIERLDPDFDSAVKRS